MKRYSKIICSLFAALLVTSCANKVLDIKDLGSYSPDNVWNDEKLANAYITNLYSSTFSGWPVNSGSNSDELPGYWDKDNYTTSNAPQSWPYSTIYKINTLLDEIDGGSLRDDIKNPIKGQALMMRAIHYSNAVLNHGGIPYIKHVQYQGIDDLEVTRNTTAECFQYLIEDIDAAIALLPARYTGDNFGRIDGSYALAFKAKILLYKASPLFNPNSGYNNAYLDEAYNVNKLAYETLVARGYKLLDNYNDVFSTERHDEVVLATVYNSPDKMNARSEVACRPLSESKNDTGGDQPIWNVIEAYPMKDGKKAGESAYTFDLQTYWVDRDPRMEQSVVWNGAIYECSGKKGRRQYTVNGIATPEDEFGPKQLFGRTGFYPRKGMSPELPQAEVGTSGIDWITMRFAEVWFNYAEIACAKGITEVGYDVLKAVRKRAGIEPGADNMYGLKSGMSATEMRKALLDEKRIEFIFEGQRFADLRRNRMFSEIDGIRKYGILAVYDGELTEDVIAKGKEWKLVPEDFVYTVQELYGSGEKVHYVPAKYYFWPIRLGSIEQNAKLEQNKDWGGSFNPCLE